MRFFCIAVFFWGFVALAQKPCDFSTVNDSLGKYKSTKEYLLYEKNFAGNATYVFSSIIISDGTPTINIQLLEKSQDFIKARCLDRNSKIYFQLADGSIVTLLHSDDESCGTMVRDDKGTNNRVTTGYFLFRKDDYERLKSSSISYMRIRFTTETADFIFRKSFTAELDGKVYDPENYFVDFFHCLTDVN